MVIIADIETDNLLDKVTKIHCLCYYDLDTKESVELISYAKIKELFNQDLTIIGHNFVTYDFPVLEKILGKLKKPKIIDTLPISWYLYPDRIKHGLAEWGEFFGIEKPKILDWKNLSIQQYCHRCAEDVNINTKLWFKQISYLKEIYEDDIVMDNLINYLSFKQDCIKEQEQIGIKLDIEKVHNNQKILSEEKENKVVQLEKVMPQVSKKKSKVYSHTVKDNSGNLFTKGDLFFNSAIQNGGEYKKEETLTKIVSWEDPNSNSHKQIKDWLYNLGWVPEHIKHVRDKKTNETKQIPQIGNKDGSGEVCDSIKKLFEKEPNLEVINGLSILSNRIATFKGFIRDQKEGRIYPSASGITNTLRFQHKVCVNLPGMGKKYAENIRSCFVANEDCLLMNCDLSNIEDRTKRHYIYKYDPKYVEDMNTPGYDAHLEIGVLAGMITQEDIDFYRDFEKRIEAKENTNEEKNRFKSIKTIRHKAKIVNFSSTYKIGADALSRNSGLKLKQAKKILRIYWERNKAILQVEDSFKVKIINNQKWIQNPVSQFWLILRNDKDKFSTVNQNTAVYCFDVWVGFMRNLSIKIGLQMHDEVLFNVNKDKIEETKKLVHKAMQLTNEKLKLNIEIGCSANVGNNYYEIH